MRAVAAVNLGSWRHSMLAVSSQSANHGGSLQSSLIRRRHSPDARPGFVALCSSTTGHDFQLSHANAGDVMRVLHQVYELSH